MHIEHLFGCLLISVCTVACGGATFEPSDSYPALDAGADSAAAPDSQGDGKAGVDGGDAAKDGDAPIQPPQDGQALDVHTDGGADAPIDVATEPSCTLTTVDIAAEADGMILAEGTNCGASISFTSSPCMDLNLSGSRVLARFGLSGDAVAAFQAHQVTKASLLVTLATKLSQCDSSLTGAAANAPGPIATYPLRSDWLEGGSYVGAQWCYRRGNGGGSWGGAANLWSQPGAAGTEDHGPLMSAVQLDTSVLTPEIPLDPEALRPWLDGNAKLSVLVTPAAGSSVMAYMLAHESGTAATLRLSWCH
ncbi:MAG: hypothetical protein HY898_21775 [Deltaproteobacteria bacterium]|nr:hypothetical protein [Deltaproteobacteria bacterium]